MAIMQVNLRWPAPPVKNWRILLVQSFTARTATSIFGGRCWSSPQQCYLHCLCTREYYLSGMTLRIVAEVIQNLIVFYEAVVIVLKTWCCSYYSSWVTAYWVGPRNWIACDISGECRANRAGSLQIVESDMQKEKQPVLFLVPVHWQHFTSQ